MRIGELARTVGVSPDTLRFYERSGLLPRLPRGTNGYRDYGPADVERVRLLLDLRRLDLPLEQAARLAAWCQAGHCEAATVELPVAVAARRAQLRERIASLRRLDARLAQLERHLGLAALPMANQPAPCCAAAALIHATEAAGPATGGRPRTTLGSRPVPVTRRTAGAPPARGTARRSTRSRG